MLMFACKTAYLYLGITLALETSLVKQMGSKNYKEREKATVILDDILQKGQDDAYSVLIAVKKATANRDLEIARRALALYKRHQKKYIFEAKYLWIYYDNKKNSELMDRLLDLGFSERLHRGQFSRPCVITCRPPGKNHVAAIMKLRCMAGITKLLPAGHRLDVPPGW